MVPLPCRKVNEDVCFHIGFVVLAMIRVQHGVFLGIVEKIHRRALGRSVLRRVFEPNVVFARGDRVHSYCDFLLEWLSRHGFRWRLILLRELV